MMPINLWRGFNRLFLVLTIGWALFCAVVLPVVYLYRLEAKLEAKHIDASASCTRDYSLSGSDLQRCYEMSDATWKEIEEPFSPKRFWLVDVQTWRRL
jgi:hypothetical protein